MDIRIGNCKRQRSAKAPAAIQRVDGPIKLFSYVFNLVQRSWSRRLKRVLRYYLMTRAQDVPNGSPCYNFSVGQKVEYALQLYVSICA